MLWPSPIAIRRADSMFKYYDGPASPYRTNSTLKDLEFRSFHVNSDKVNVILLINYII